MLRKIAALIAAVMLTFGLAGTSVAKTPPSSGGSGMSRTMAEGHHITNAERKAAAVAALKARKAAGLSTTPAIHVATGTTNASATSAAIPVGLANGASLATPDYFGSIPNYANSPLPTSVSIQGDGLGAFATATISGGVVQTINVIAQGAGYTFANVVVIGGGGSGATGTATIAGGAITTIAVVTGGSGYDTVPGIRKFVDALPLPGGSGNGAAANEVGQYLPVAVPDKTTFAGTTGAAPAADYYEIAVVQYNQQMHSDLPPTTLRGYVQVETPAIAANSKHFPLTYPNGSAILDGNGKPVFAVDPPQYLGPLIVAQSGRPVRVKFDNYLPTGTGGDLFIPVDDSIMGAGAGPNGGNYSQNRATLHLHGGVTPWISDGTPDQWVTPATSTEQYPKGVSTAYVPDMWYDANGNDVGSCDGLTTCVTDPTATTDPGQGHMTFYYTNQQSARLMFYHDHSYGTTRLNVYAGEAAGYLLQDQAEAALKAAGTLPSDANQIPLVIEDKTFVPSPTQLAAEDPTWSTSAYGGYGNLWFPHVYMTNQDPAPAANGVNPMGRWDYGAWFWPLFTSTVGTSPNPLCPGTTPCGIEPNVIPGTPNPSIVPEAFMDTMTVNGTAYPYVQVGPQAYRLRILNASNDRTLNLSLFYAGTETPPTTAGGTPTFTKCLGQTLTASNLNPCSEVAMVPAVKGGYGTTGYVYPDQLDGRDGGVPDANSAGPKMVQIGTEGGFLAAPATIPNAPIGYEYNRRNVVVLNVSQRSLTLGPAERADVIVDFSGAPAGSNIILYNDAPAPMPAFDSRYDYFTGDQDQVSSGGAPTTLPGYGPNTRTVLQFQVTGAAGAGISPNLSAGISSAFHDTQPAPVVMEPGYDAAYGTTTLANYTGIQTQQSTFTTGTVTGITVNSGGSGYTNPPAVIISGGGGAGATAVATLTGNGAVASITMTSGGTGYTSQPTVALTGGAPGTGATATATYSSSVVTGSFLTTTAGSGYSSPPSVSFTGGGGSGAAATAILGPAGVASVTVASGQGGAYTSTPGVVFSAPQTGTNLPTANATLGAAPVVLGTVATTSAGSGYTSAPTVGFTGGGGTVAANATATLAPTSVGSLTLTNPGTLYQAAPSVLISGNGTGAAASTTLALVGSLGTINLSNGGTGYTRVPTVSLSGGGGSGATAAVTALTPTGVGSVQMVSGGSCKTRTPVPPVTFSSVNGAGSGAAGTATIGGQPLRVTGVTVTNRGSGYTLPPTISFGGTNCTGVSANVILQPTSVAAITITARGQGYTTPPRVSFNGGGGGSGAAATATLAFPLASINLTAGGSGYTATPTVTIAPPTLPGTPAAATATLMPTGVATITVTAGGSYTSAPTVTFTAPQTTGTLPTATVSLAPQPVATVSMLTPGDGYTSPPTVSFSGGGQTVAAVATATLLPAGVASINVTAGGAGYASAPTVSFSGTGGAAAKVALVPAAITGLTLVTAGSGYTSAPIVSVNPVDGNGSGAAGTTTIGPGSIASVAVTNPGSGYAFPPTITFSGGGGSGAAATAAVTPVSVTLKFQPKGIQELFDSVYNRMNATMSVEIPNTNGTNQTTIPYGYIDPPTELVNTANAAALSGAVPLEMLPDGTQIWRFTHNGVDTHSVHFHMFNVEIVNRVGWDGVIRPPDANEIGWKDTVRMSPLEDAIIAIKPIVPNLPWPLPNSIRPLDVTTPLGIAFSSIDPNGVGVTGTNHLINFGWEYVYHCHLLGHEENDMMRPMLFGVAPISPSGVAAVTPSATAAAPSVDVTFIDNSVNETSFTVQRSSDNGVTWANAGTVARPAPVWNAVTQSVTDAGVSTGGTVSFTDTAVASGITYEYRAIANDVIGDAGTPGFPTMSIDSAPSAAATVAVP